MPLCLILSFGGVAVAVPTVATNPVPRGTEHTLESQSTVAGCAHHWHTQPCNIDMSTMYRYSLSRKRRSLNSSVRFRILGTQYLRHNG